MSFLDQLKSQLQSGAESVAGRLSQQKNNLRSSRFANPVVGAPDLSAKQTQTKPKMVSPVSRRSDVQVSQPTQQVLGKMDQARDNMPSPQTPQINIEDFYRNQLGPANRATTNLNEYYPVLNEIDYLKELEDQYQRPGLANLLALQAFFESTGGKSTTNLFGVKPGGSSQKFPSAREAINYQVGPNVLAGGGNPANMNILDTTGQINENEIRQLYKSYDPPGAYIEQLIDAYRQMMGI